MVAIWRTCDRSAMLATISRSGRIVRPIASGVVWGSDLNPRNISTLYNVSEQTIGGTTGRNVARPVARLIVRPLTICNIRLQVLNMTIVLVATDLRLAITHNLCDQSYDLCDQSYDHCDQSYVLSTIDPRFKKKSVAGRS